MKNDDFNIDARSHIKIFVTIQYVKDHPIGDGKDKILIKTPLLVKQYVLLLEILELHLVKF